MPVHRITTIQSFIKKLLKDKKYVFICIKIPIDEDISSPFDPTEMKLLSNVVVVVVVAVIVVVAVVVHRL